MKTAADAAPLSRFIREGIRRPIILHGSAYALLVSMHLAMAYCMRYPTTFYDEITYLGFARYFAGVSHVPNLTGGGFGHFGYALFLIPAFLLSSAPFHQYQLALAINSLLIATSYFSLYYLLSKLTDLPRRALVAISFATCLYPPFLIFSSIVATENAFISLYLLAAVFLLLMIEKRTVATAILAGCATGMTYAIHSRGLSLVIGAALLLVGGAALRKLPWHLAAIPLLIIAGAYAVTNWENLRLLALGYSGSGPPPSGETLARLKSAKGFQAFLLVFLGQIVYLMQATYCLYFAGAAYMVAQARNGLGGASRSTRIAISGMLLATALAVALGSAIFIAPQDPYHRADHLLIGRYNDGVAAIFIAFSLALVWRAASDRGARVLLVRCVAAAAITLAIGTFIVSPFAVKLGVCSMNSLANMPAIWLSGGKGLWPATIFVLAISGALAFVFYRWRQRVIVAVALLFLAGGAYIFRRQYSQRMRPPGTQLAILTDRLARAGRVPEIDYDMSCWQPFYYSTYQLLLPQTYFVQFDSARGQLPKSAVVIASESWKDGPRLGYEYLDREPGEDQALWLSPPSLAEKLSPGLSYIDREVGSEMVARVRTEGLYPVEGNSTAHFRWTNGKASIHVPLSAGEVAGRVAIDLYAFQKTRTAISINGNQVLNVEVGPGTISKLIPLPVPQKGGVLDVQIGSGTFVQSEPPRVLGVETRSVKVLP